MTLLHSSLVGELPGEEVEVDGFAHGFVAGVAGVEVVAGVVEDEEHSGVSGVGGDFVEVDDAVELVGGSDPVVDGLAHLFASGGLVFRSDEWGEGRADDLDAVGVGAGGELAEACDEVVGGDDVVGLGWVGGVADVVDALHDDEIFHSRLGDDVAVEAGECGGAGGVVEDAVAADALIQDAEVCGLLVGLEAAGEDVGPAGVGVACAVGAVGDAVAEGDDGGGFVVAGDVDSFEEVPGEEGLRGVERGGADDVAGDEVVGLVGEGVEGELADGLVGEEEADGEVGGGSDFDGGGVADGEGSGLDDDGGLAAEGECGCGAGGDGAGAGAESDLCGADGQGVEAEFIGENDADGGAADGDVDDFAEGGAVGSGGPELAVWIFCRHGGCCPGSDPVVGGCCRGGAVRVEEADVEQEEERDSGLDRHGSPWLDLDWFDGSILSLFRGGAGVDV
jgi:hypothetical protein